MLYGLSRRDATDAWERCSAKQRETFMSSSSLRNRILNANLIRRAFRYQRPSLVKKLCDLIDWGAQDLSWEIRGPNKSKYGGHKDPTPTQGPETWPKEDECSTFSRNYSLRCNSRGLFVTQLKEFKMDSDSTGEVTLTQLEKCDLAKGAILQPISRCCTPSLYQGIVL